MEYRIEYSKNSFNYANSRKDLIEWLNLLREENITDIKKIYKNGSECSVLDKYTKYIDNSCR